jgi:multidrug resistance efflux pump
LLRHRAPPGLKRLGKIAVIAALVIAATGIGWRRWESHATAAWTED